MQISENAKQQTPLRNDHFESESKSVTYSSPLWGSSIKGPQPSSLCFWLFYIQSEENVPSNLFIWPNLSLLLFWPFIYLLKAAHFLRFAMHTMCRGHWQWQGYCVHFYCKAHWGQDGYWAATCLKSCCATFCRPIDPLYIIFYLLLTIKMQMGSFIIRRWSTTTWTAWWSIEDTNTGYTLITCCLVLWRLPASPPSSAMACVRPLSPQWQRPIQENDRQQAKSHQSHVITSWMNI